ncbi:MAG: PPOX class F420-dependent oxidoreductase [Nocardioidaceae bacterium]|nr:PPOX class F420-dependent oxidoreductase [Nocardioidaceae bacterium]
MKIFTQAELSYLDAAQGLARVATVGADGTPHVTPVGWAVTADQQALEVGGNNLAATKKYRDIARNGRAALVIDEVLPPWRPRGIEVRGPAEAITEPEPRIRLHPHRIVSWGFDGATGARTVDRPAGPSTSSAADQPVTGAPYAVVRRVTYGPAALTTAAAELEEFQRVHARQPGYQGNVVVDAGDNVRLTVTLWESDQHAADAGKILRPAVHRLLDPLMTEPAELLATGPVTTIDLRMTAPPTRT